MPIVPILGVNLENKLTFGSQVKKLLKNHISYMDYKDCKSISYKLVAPSCKASTIFCACQNFLAEIIGYCFTDWFGGVLYQFLSTQPNLYRFLSFFFLLEFVSSELYESQYQLNQLILHEAAQARMDLQTYVYFDLFSWCPVGQWQNQPSLGYLRKSCSENMQ